MEMEKKLREDILNKVRDYYALAHKKKNFIPGETTINYSGRVYDERELVNLVDSSLEFWLTSGRYVKEFEKKFAEYIGVNFCSVTNSGSSANLLAVSALTSPKLGEKRLKSGDEVITVAAGFPTTIAPLIQNNLVPVFVDVELGTYNINCSMLETALSEKTRAVMIAHTLGNPFDIDRVRDFCEKNNLWLIEDNCDAVGTMYKGKMTGTFGHIATTSFYPPHHITMGEGGALLTNNVLLKKLIDSFRDWGRDCWCPSGKDNTCCKRFGWSLGDLPQGYDHKYIYSHFGYNLKVTDMQAAVGLAQLQKLPSFVEARRSNFAKIYKGLQDLENIFVLPKVQDGSNPSWFGFLMTIKDNAGFSREEIVNFLEDKKIQTRMLFSGNMIKQPCFDSMRESGTGYRVVSNNGRELPVTDKIMKDSFWIGVYPGLSDEKINYMVDAIKSFVANKTLNSNIYYKDTKNMEKINIEGVKIKPLKKISDERGTIMHMLRNDDPDFDNFGEIYFSTCYLGAIKGWHLHKKMTLNYAVVIGMIKLVLFDARENSPTKGRLQEIFIGEKNYARVTVPPGVINGYKCIGEKEAIVANCATLPHDPSEIVRIEPFTKEVPYNWDIKHG